MTKLTYNSEYTYSNSMDYNAEEPAKMYVGDMPVKKLYLGSIQVTDSFITGALTK